MFTGMNLTAAYYSEVSSKAHPEHQIACCCSSQDNCLWRHDRICCNRRSTTGTDWSPHDHQSKPGSLQISHSAAA